MFHATTPPDGASAAARFGRLDSRSGRGTGTQPRGFHFDADRTLRRPHNVQRAFDRAGTQYFTDYFACLPSRCRADGLRNVVEE